MTRQIGGNPAALMRKAKECPKRFELLACRNICWTTTHGTGAPYQPHYRLRCRKTVQCGKSLALTKPQAVLVQRTGNLRSVPYFPIIP